MVTYQVSINTVMQITLYLMFEKWKQKIPYGLEKKTEIPNPRNWEDLQLYE